MAAVSTPFVWFYNAFGLASIHATGLNAYLLIFARSSRMFAFGAGSLILAIYFSSSLHFSPAQIGLFMTFTLLGEVILGTLLTLIADRVGRRRVLFLGSLLMVLSGAVFAYFENFWILLLAAVIGIVSATGGDYGPFRAIEESVISHLTTPETRADVLAWYVTTATWGSALGSEVGGRVIHYLLELPGWRPVDAYHALFMVYIGMGLVNAGIVLLLTDACEVCNGDKQAYAELSQSETVDDEDSDPLESSSLETAEDGKATAPQTVFRRILAWPAQWLSSISPPTLSIMYKLWLLLALDSLADGMVSYSLTNYYLDQKFHPTTSTLGDINSIAYFLGALSSVFAGPLARYLGLIRTMVYTHIPSSAAVLVFPFPPHLALTVVLLCVRAGLNNMDQAPRSAFIAAVVKPEERTAVMGITSMLRTLAAMFGPTVTGVLAGSGRFWVAFVAAGAFRLAYDIGLYALFVNAKLHRHEGGEVDRRLAHYTGEEAVLDMQSVTGRKDSQPNTGAPPVIQEGLE